MDKLDGITFYAHSKGQGVMDDIEETIFFITAAYYFSLENIDNVNYYPFYGSFKMTNNSPMPTKRLKHMWFYVGTFFWGKYQEIYKNKKKFPTYSSRWFNEMLPGELYSPDECGSFLNREIDATIKPYDAYNLIERIYGDNEEVMNNFYSFYNNVRNKF
jgi:hypothetical protein